jgi:hypothetical protein
VPIAVQCIHIEFGKSIWMKEVLAHVSVTSLECEASLSNMAKKYNAGPPRR